MVEGERPSNESHRAVARRVATGLALVTSLGALGAAAPA